MFTTLLDPAGAAAPSMQDAGGFPLALVLMAVLLGVVVLREIAAGASVGWLRHLARGTTMTLVPLGLGGLFIVGSAVVFAIGHAAR